LVALVWKDVSDGDADAARRHLGDLGAPHSNQP